MYLSYNIYMLYNRYNHTILLYVYLSKTICKFTRVRVCVYYHKFFISTFFQRHLKKTRNYNSFSIHSLVSLPVTKLGHHLQTKCWWLILESPARYHPTMSIYLTRNREQFTTRTVASELQMNIIVKWRSHGLTCAWTCTHQVQNFDLLLHWVINKDNIT